MKSTLHMEAKKQQIDGELHEQVKSSKISSRRILLFSVLGLTALLITVGIVLTSLYFGTRILHEEIREYSATILTRDHGIRHETIKITDNEAQTESDFMVVVRDYRANVMVYKLSGANECYVAVFNDTLGKDGIFNESRFTTVETETTMMDYKITDTEFSIEVLSNQGRRLCHGKKLLWAQKMSQEEHIGHREKRSTVPNNCCCGCCNCCCGITFHS